MIITMIILIIIMLIVTVSSNYNILSECMYSCIVECYRNIMNSNSANDNEKLQ